MGTFLIMPSLILLLLPLLCSASPHLDDRGFLEDIWGAVNPIDNVLQLLNAPSNTTESAETTTESTEGGDTFDAVAAITDVLTGVTNVLPLDLIKNLLGLKNPVPSPLDDPIGFLKHPLIVPILMGAITFNPPAMALAMGALAGNMALMHLFAMAEDMVAATTVATI